MSKKQDLYNFSFKGTKNGNSISSEITAKDERTARALLRKQEIKVLKIKKIKPPSAAAGKKIKSKDISVMTRQLATMLASGVPLMQSFEILARGDKNPRLANILFDIKADVESGTSLSESLAKHPLYFDKLYCSLVEAGESAGVLDLVLTKIAIYKEKSESLKAKIKKALTYPIGVMVVAGIVTAILLLFVVPVFEDMFKEFGSDLPAFTRFVVDLSESLQETWYIYLIVIFSTITGFSQGKKRSRKFNEFLDHMIIRLPVIGDILRKGVIARFARTMATLSASGIPLVEALTSVATASGNIVFENAILKMREDVSSGIQLQISMQQSGLFPHVVVSMTAIGEESGNLDAMLEKVADFFEEEVDNAVDNLTAMLEPIIMAFLGVVIGGLIIAMYLPIFKMGAAI